MADDTQVIEDLEIDLLLEGVFRRFDHDFRGYQREPVRAKLHALMEQAGVRTVSALQERVMHDGHWAAMLLRALSMKPRGLFDDPEYFQALRDVLIPWLRSCPSPRIWVAECVSAEEVCALSIVLLEEGLYEKTQIFATAANENLLREASEGSFDIAKLAQYERNYRDSGGKAELSRYCGWQEDRVMFSRELLSNVTWAQYSLATDASFNEFQLIVCRQVLADFGTPLQRRALQLFYDSMPLFGLLSIDRNEVLGAAPFVSRYKPVVEEQGLYRRMV